MVEVELNHEKQLADIWDEDKGLSKFHVKKSPGGYLFFHVEVEKGKVPEALSGKYTSLELGVRAVTHYLNTRPKTRGLRSQEYKEGLEERIAKKNAAKSSTEGS